MTTCREYSSRWFDPARSTACTGAPARALRRSPDHQRQVLHAGLGDSSYIVGLPACLGYQFLRVEQTGSNFGPPCARHPVPLVIGTRNHRHRCLTILNTDYSSTSFKVSRVGSTAHFLGNGIFYPARAQVGDDCLPRDEGHRPDEQGRPGGRAPRLADFEIPRWVERTAGWRSGRCSDAADGGQEPANLVGVALLLLTPVRSTSRWCVALGGSPSTCTPSSAPSPSRLRHQNLLLTYTYLVLLDRTVRGSRRRSRTACRSTTRVLAPRRTGRSPPTPTPAAQRHPVEERALASAGCAGRRGYFDDGC